MPQGQQSNQMPSKGRTRQGHVKCQDTSGGLIGVQRGNTVCFGEKHLGSERRPKFRRALGLGTVERRRNSTGLGFVPNGIGHGVRFLGGSSLLVSFRRSCCFASISGEKT
jgi:hypothetical protein